MDIFSLINKKLVLERLVIGIQEPVLVKGLGELTAKVDSGNGGLNVIHGENFVLQGDTLLFDTKNDKGETRKLSKKVVGYIDVNIGGGNIQHRPIIELDIKFADTNYKKIKFSVTDRTTNDTLILMSKSFVQDELDALIDVSATNLTKDGTLEAEIVSEALNTGSGIVDDGKKPKEEITKGPLGGFVDKAKKINKSIDSAKKVFKAIGGDRSVSLLGSLNDFIGSLYGVDKIREFLAQFKKDPYYKADKPKIQEAANKKANDLVSLGVKLDKEATIIKIVDFTGNGWDDNATQIFQGKAGFIKMSDSFKNASNEIKSLDELINSEKTNNQEENNQEENQQANESFIIKEADTPINSQPAAPQTQTTPAQATGNPSQTPAPVQTQQQTSTANTQQQGQKNNKEENSKVAEFVKKIEDKCEELKSKNASATTTYNELDTLKEEINSSQELDDNKKKDLIVSIDKKIVEFMHDKIASIENFIIYFASYDNADYEKILKEKVLTPDIISTILKIFDDGGGSRDTIDNAISALQKQLSEGINAGLSGYLALCTGNLNDRKAQIFPPLNLPEGNANETDSIKKAENIVSDIELPILDTANKDNNKDNNSDAKIEKIINEIELPVSSGQDKAANSDAKIEKIISEIELPQIKEEEKSNHDAKIDDIINNIELPGNNSEKAEDPAEKVKNSISSVSLPQIPTEDNVDSEQTQEEQTITQ